MYCALHLSNIKKKAVAIGSFQIVEKKMLRCSAKHSSLYDLEKFTIAKLSPSPSQPIPSWGLK